MIFFSLVYFFLTLICFNTKNSELSSQLKIELIQTDQNKRVVTLKYILESNNTSNDFNDLQSFFYEHDLLAFYRVATLMQEAFKLPNEIIKKIFFESGNWLIFSKVFNEPLVRKNHDILYPITFEESYEQHHSVYNYIKIPNTQTEISSFFALKNAFFTHKYVVIDHRHQALNSDGSIFNDQNGFHNLYIYTIEQLLKMKEKLNLENEPIFFKIDLPVKTIDKKYPINIFDLKDNILIMEDYYPNKYRYIYLNLDNLNITPIIIKENLELKENVHEKQSCDFFNFLTKCKKKLISLLQMLKKFCQKIISNQNHN